MALPRHGLRRIHHPDYNGASADTVDNQVTSVIEGAIARVQGISSISSSSRQSRSSVDMSFVQGTNLETAISDVRSALSRIADQLPTGVIPTVVKGDPNAQPIMQLSVTSTTMRRDDLTNLVDIGPLFGRAPYLSTTGRPRPGGYQVGDGGPRGGSSLPPAGA